MNVKVELGLNHGYLFDPPHICTLPLWKGSDGRGDEQSGVSVDSSPHVNSGFGGACAGIWGKLYMELITALCSHGCSCYVFMYGSKIMCTHSEEGQRDGGVFPCGKEMHPIHSAMFTLGCLTHSESNLISITCFKSHLNIQYILSTYNKNEFLLNVTVLCTFGVFMNKETLIKSLACVFVTSSFHFYFYISSQPALTHHFLS